jgi:hypothetical protein
MATLMVTRSEALFQHEPLYAYGISLAVAGFVVGVDIVIRYIKQKRKEKPSEHN